MSDDTKTTSDVISEYILNTAKLLCDNKDIRIESEGENTVIYKIYAPKEERGKIIGKQGTTIHSIRDIAQKIASPKNFKIQINIIE